MTDIDQISKDQNIDEIKNLVTKLYIALNLEESEENKKNSILKEIEALKVELEPLEKVKKKAEKFEMIDDRRMCFLSTEKRSIGFECKKAHKSYDLDWPWRNVCTSWRTG